LQQVDADDVIDGLADPDADPQANALSREQNAAIWAAVERLPEKYRLVLTLFYQQELSYQEIAELLSLPLGTVKAHLNRARQALARQLCSSQEAGDVDMC
jgi:RNA polymerase sigma-70 factor (ECF subfamily)